MVLIGANVRDHPYHTDDVPEFNAINRGSIL